MPTPRRPRSPGIEAIVSNQTTFTVLLLAAQIPYAGDDPDHRPMPEVSLYDFKKGLYLDQNMLTETWHVPDAMYFAFADKKYRWGMKDVITVPTEQLWGLVMPGDTVLLSDYVTHHYTGIREVDRENDRIYFADQWPDRFFLKAGLNTANVKVDDTLGISREEFLRVIVGLVTLDTPDLPLYYINQNPEHFDNGELLRRIGLAILDEGRDRLVNIAAQYLARAYDLTQQSTVKSDKQAIAAESYLALCMAIYSNKDEPLADKPYQDKLKQLLENHTEDDLLNLLKAEDLGRIAFSAGNASQYKDAEKYFNLAVEKYPNHEYNLYLRATIRLINGKNQDAIQDISQSLVANAENKEKTYKSLQARDRRDHFGIGRDNAQISHLEDQYVKSLTIRCTAYINTKQLDLATKDANNIIQQQPNQPEGYLLQSQIAKSQQDWNNAIQNLQKADSFETSPSKKAVYAMEIEQISQLGEPA